MSSSSPRKRPPPASPCAPSRKRHTVNWSTDLEAGPSGTGNTDTRTRSPERTSFPGLYFIPTNLSNLKSGDAEKAIALRRKTAERVKNKWYDEKDARRMERQEWTDFVLEKYGIGTRVTEKGILPPGDDGDCQGDGAVVSEDEYLVTGPRVTKKALQSSASKKATKLFNAREKLFSANATEDNGKDAVVCEEMFKLIQEIQVIGRVFADKQLAFAPKQFMDHLLKKENEQTIRYIGCLAMGGKNGKEAWEELLSSHDTREALVVGMLGRALKEHVFSKLWFGGTKAEEDELRQMEKAEQDSHDGFHRTEKRAKRVKSFFDKTDENQLEYACSTMTLQLEKLLAPFYDGKAKMLPTTVRSQLRGVVDSAASLSRFMRLASDVIYMWSQTFKDEEFGPDRMECYNLEHMILSSPYERKVINGIERAIPRAGAERLEAIVKIVCFQGLVAYRKGGGRLAAHEIAQDKAREDKRPPDVKRAQPRLVRPGGGEYTGHEGFRSKMLCKSIVHLIWGKQRLLTREAGTSAHIDAVREGNMNKYVEDSAGCAELYDLAQQKWDKGKARGRQ